MPTEPPHRLGPAPRRRVSVTDVAREAGVSLGTVSNVLNRPNVVAPTTRARVLSVIDSLGYVRAEGAKQLRGWTARLLAVMVPDLTNPFYTALAAGVEQAAREADLGVMLCAGTHRPTEDSRYLSLLASHQFRGVVLASSRGVGRTVAALRRNAIPFVMADQNAPQPEACSVGTDDFSGGRAAVRHLIETGHRSIGYVGGPEHLQQVRDRRQGAMDAISQSGLPSTTLLELSCSDLTVVAGRHAGQQLLGLAHRPTSVFCANDLLALGVMQAAYEAGLRVPRDIAVVGYDDIEFAASAVVPLTSVRRPAVAMGHLAGQLLIAETDHSASHKHVHSTLQPELIVRQSTQSRAADLQGLHL